MVLERKVRLREMAPIKAIAKNVSFSPKRLKPIMDSNRGMGVDEALLSLSFFPSDAAVKVSKAVRSAAANAENNQNVSRQSLVIIGANADKGIRLKRFRARARGRAGPITKQYSHITIVVDQRS